MSLASITAEIFSNFAGSTLNGGITSGATALVVQTADAAAFPSSFPFYCTLGASTAAPEVIKVTNRSGANFTVVRQQDGTSASAWSTSATIQHTLSAGSLTRLWTALLAVNTGTLPATSLSAGAIPAGVTLPATQLTSGAIPAGVTIAGNQLTGTVVAPGNETVAGTLGVTGAITASSTLSVTGAITASSTLGVVGASSLDNGAIVTDALGTVSGTGGAAPAALTTSVQVNASGLSIGVYGYKYTYYTALGESTLSANTAATTTSGHLQVNLTSIAAGPAGTVGRKVYRTKVGGSSYFLLTTIADNTTTTYNDTTADASITVAAPTHPTLGGDIWKASGGAVQAQIYGDGAASFDVGKITTGGDGSLSIANGTLTTDALGNLTKASGQAAVGSGLAYPIVQGGQTVSSTGAKTIATTTTNTSSTGWYMGCIWFRQGNVAAENLTVLLNYTDGASSARSHPFAFTVASAVQVANGATSFTQAAVYAAMPIVVWAAANTTISITYNDPAGTPSDNVQAVIVRVA